MRNRILLALGVTAVAVVGVMLQGRATANSRAELAQLREHEVTAVSAQATAAQRDMVMHDDDRKFQRTLDDDSERFGLQPIAAADLLAPNRYEHLIEDNVELSPGQRFDSEWVQIRAAVEPVQYIKRGAEIRAKHSVVYVENVHETPIAYFLDVRSADLGGCEVRGSRSHNALALLPGEVAEIVVCAGTKPVEIHDLQVMEMKAIGFMYLSSVPARAFGHDDVRAQSHQAPRQVRRCSHVPEERLREAVAQQLVEWRDLADYFSRHNCDQYPWVWGYSFAESPLESLPVDRRDIDEGERKAAQP